MQNKNEIIWYHPDLVQQARELRNNCTYSEKKLWESLKGKRMEGYDFHRQKPLVYFIVDFFCPKLRLVIEIDGMIHESEENQIRDQIRQEKIQEYGITFLRFKDSDIKNDIEKVVDRIRSWIKEYEKAF